MSKNSTDTVRPPQFPVNPLALTCDPLPPTAAVEAALSVASTLAASGLFKDAQRALSLAWPLLHAACRAAVDPGHNATLAHALREAEELLSEALPAIEAPAFEEAA